MNYHTIKRIFKIIICFIILLCTHFIFTGVSYSSSKSKSEIGQYIAEFSVNFANIHGSETVYSWTAYQRGKAYEGYKTTGVTCFGVNYTNKYAMDCVGWVSFAIHHATGLDVAQVRSGACGFVTPQSGVGNSNGYFEIVSGSPQPGDILISPSTPHVMVYIGNNQVVDSWSVGGNAVQIRSIQTYSQIARISNLGIQAINDSNLTTIFNGQGSITGSIDTNNGEEENVQFEYNGLQEGKFGVFVYSFDWILNSLKGILNWFIGIVSYLIRMVVIGWTAIIESLVNTIMEWTTGEEASLTIEKLVNNQVPFLDVNFFNFSMAGGEEIQTDSIVYIIRENISVWYYIIRNISIIGLLITLLYIGIRMAFSTIGEQRAKYKELLISWVTSFIIVFFIHYVMIIILNINSSLIELIHLTLNGAEESLYDSVKSAAYAIPASIGWTGLIMYVALIYLLVKFLFMYFKRFLVVGILTFMAPILGVTYAIDKIKDNKSQSLSNWLKEYTFNVLIQSVHALLYTLCISLAFNIMGTSIQGCFIAILLVNFVLKAEVIFKNIFGIKSGSLKDAIKSTIMIMNVATIARNVVGANAKVFGFVTKPITSPIKDIVSKTKDYRRNDKVEKVKKSIEQARALGNTTVKVGRRSFEIGQLIQDGNIYDTTKVARELVDRSESIKKENRKEIKQQMSETLSTVLGTAQMVTAAGMIVADGEEGLAMYANARSNLKKGINGTDNEITVYKTKGGKIKNILTAGVYGNVKSINRRNKKYKKKINNNIYNAQHEVAIKLLQKRIFEQREKLEKDASINQEELDKIIQQEMRILSDNLIYNIIYKLNATMENTVSVSLDTETIIESIDYKIDELVGNSLDIDSLLEKVKAMQMPDTNNHNTYYINTNKFEKSIHNELITIIAKEKQVKKKEITEEEIKEKYEKMDSTTKKEIIHNSMVQAITQKEKYSLEDLRDQLAEETKELGDLHNNIEKIFVDKNNKKIKIETKKFEENIQDGLVKIYAQENKINKKDVTKEAIEERFRNMSNEEKKQLMKQAMLKATKSKLDLKEEKSEKERLEKKKSNMKLNNVEEIIDLIEATNNVAINNTNYKKNFEHLIKTNIAKERKVSIEQVSASEVDKYIRKLTNKELIRNIKIAGANEDSFIRHEDTDKQEYSELINDIRKLRYHKAQLKGTK